jgi:hypothetical protein
MGLSIRPPAVATGMSAAAATALALGAAVYLVARTPEATHLGVGAGLDPWPLLTGSLPAWCHAFGLVLVTSVAAGPSLASARLAAIGWGLIGVLFETLQHPSIAAWLPDPSTMRPGLGALVAGHAHRGTFDPLDLVATVAGAATALVLAARWLRAAGRA